MYRYLAIVLNVRLDRLSDAFVVAGGCSTSSPADVVVDIRVVDGVQCRQLLVVRRLRQRPWSLALQHRLSHIQGLQLMVQVSESVTVPSTC